MSDHRHETYDIYGTAATSGDIEQVQRYISGLREDLGIAEQAIRDLEERVSTLQSVLSAHLADAGQPVSAEAVKPS